MKSGQDIRAQIKRSDIYIYHEVEGSATRNIFELHTLNLLHFGDFYASNYGGNVFIYANEK